MNTVKFEAPYLGIDIGGTGIKAGLVTADGNIILERTVRTPIEEGRAGMMREISRLAADLMEASAGSVEGIGIGSAGLIDPDSGEVIYATDNLPGWTGLSLASSVSRATGLPVWADNDVHTAALGEVWMGAARDYHSFALVALGTGVGGAIVRNGQISHGFGGRSGEIGHMILEQDGLLCNCGQRGCMEQYVSGSALNRIARVIEPDWDSRRLIREAQASESRALQAIDQFAARLAAGLISIYHLIGPQSIVIGGGLVNSADVWWSRLEHALRRKTDMPIRIEPAGLGNRAGIIGAAYMVKCKLR
ncbi:ROK family protein [Paenibacillus sp. 1011MAR3C5]|uniref:ROK family protein n=1 Tax=Paenibacillus sp. 1011MAR3C5 TaxID=1675787 RepID=UPI0016013F1B|nr:ROK family protein [Paenibacillus sp. 1011MAR3C5]